MADADTANSGQPQPFWSRIPDYWKFVTILIAIAITAISGYRWFDDTIDGLDQKISNVELALEKRIEAVETGKVENAELENYVPSDLLRIETCNLSWQLQLLEFRALAQAYDELFETMNLAADLYRGRELSDAEKHQLTEIVGRRSAIATKKEDIDTEMSALQTKFVLNRGCE